MTNSSCSHIPTEILRSILNIRIAWGATLLISATHSPVQFADPQYSQGVDGVVPPPSWSPPSPGSGSGSGSGEVWLRLQFTSPQTGQVWVLWQVTKKVRWLGNTEFPHIVISPFKFVKRTSRLTKLTNSSTSDIDMPDTSRWNPEDNS